CSSCGQIPQALSGSYLPTHPAGAGPPPSAKVRWMSIPITRCMSCSFQLWSTGAVGDTTTTDPRSQHNRVGRRGGQLLTRALGSSCRIGLPTDVLPVPLVPDGHTIC